MNAYGRVSISAKIFNLAYLQRTWPQRQHLTEYERRGFAQSMYTTICAHVEGKIQTKIITRLTTLSQLVDWRSFAPITYNLNGVPTEVSLDPVAASIRSIADGIRAECTNAPMTKMIEIYNRVFPTQFREAVGNELAEDLGCITTLRNIFAHGRDITMDLVRDEDGGIFGDLDKHPFKRVASRLKQTSILKSTTFTGNNHDELLVAISSDDALLHFYNAARRVEAAIRSSDAFCPEAELAILEQPDLPVLDQ
jgi:hypothetical protein